MTVTGQLPAPSIKVSGASLAKLKRKLKGDLDNIVLKTLRKEPERRYTSVEQLADDVRRHLEGLPVRATPDSLYYRAGKFVRRHQAGMIAAALLVIAIAGGVATTVREARIATINEKRAEKRFNDVRRLANSLMFEIHDSIKDLPGSTPARRLLVTRALEYLDDLSKQSQGDISLQKELALAYERVGDVLGYPYGPNLGDTAGALQSYQKAMAIRESLAAADPKDQTLQVGLGEVYLRVAHVWESSGDFKKALDALHKALPIKQKLAAGSKDPVILDQLAGNYYFIAGLLIKTGDPSGALESYRHAASVHQAGLDANPNNAALRTHLAGDNAGIAQLLAEKGDLEQAIQMQNRSIAILAELAQADSTNAMLREYMGEGIDGLGSFQTQQNHPGEAVETYRKAHQIFRDLLAADPQNVLAKENFALTDNEIAASLVALGKPDAAVKILREAAAGFEAMSPRTSDNRYTRSGLADTYSGLGDAYSALADSKKSPSQRRHYWQEARSDCEKSLTLWKQKEELGELESGERNKSQVVTQCIAKCDSHLGVSLDRN
jgi:tetratricopeptide (TPR) repeat protein